MLIQVFSRHATRKIKAFAENWVKPQLEGRPVAFHRAVQRKLGEFAARNTLRSPFVYAAVEDLAEKEVEHYGQIFLAGYKQAFAAVSNPIRSATLTQVKRDLDALLSSESDRALKAVQYVREACKPVPARDAVALRDTTETCRGTRFVCREVEQRAKGNVFQKASRSHTAALRCIVRIQLCSTMGCIGMVALFVSAFGSLPN